MPAGRPPAFKDAAEMQSLITDYFSNPPTKPFTTKEGVIDLPVITITGLCLHLGFDSRQSFYDYEKKDKFAYTIKRARMMIENEYEAQLRMGNPTGAIFALKNFGWTDKQELEHSGEQSININLVDYRNNNT